MELSQLLQLHIDKPYLKKQPDYGLKISKALHAQVSGNKDNFFKRRANQWKQNRKFSKGEQEMSEFKDLMRIQGNQAYVNLDWRPPKIAPKFMEQLLGMFMDYNEKPKVKAIDDISVTKKEQDKIDALFRMKEKGNIQQLQQVSGVELEDGYTPEDEDEFTLYFNKYRLPEELFFQKVLEKCMSENDYTQLKRRILRDIADVNFAVTKIWKDANGNYRIRRCKPENIVHNLFESDNGKDELQFIGEVRFMKIIDIRRQYKIDEKVLFELAQRSTAKPSDVYLSWNDSYRLDQIRPYDDASVPVFSFEVRTVDVNYSVVKKDRNGNPNVKPKDSKPVYDEKNPKSPNSELIEEKRSNIYEGVWVIDTEVMLAWGVQEDQIKPYQNVSESLFSYSVICPNNDGSIVPSLMDKASTPIRMLTLVHMKIIHLLAEMKPSNVAINVTKLNDLDLGLSKTVDAMEALRIWQQRGVVFYADDPDNTERAATIPITSFATDEVQKLQTLIEQYRFWQDKLENETGVSGMLTGAGIKPRLNEMSVEQGMKAGTYAVSYIYDGFISLWNETMNKLCIKYWDKVVLAAQQYKELTGCSLSLLDMEFEVSVDMLPDDNERQMLEQHIQTALSAGLLDFEDAYKVRNIDDTDIAEVYLSRAAKKKRQEAQDDAKAQSDYNANVQVKSAQAAEQAKAQTAQIEGDIQMAVDKQATENLKETTLISKILDLHLQAMVKGTQIPAELKDLSTYVLANAVKPMVKDEQQEMMQAQAQAQQQQQQAPQEGAPQEQQPQDAMQ